MSYLAWRWPFRRAEVVRLLPSSTVAGIPADGMGVLPDYRWITNPDVAGPFVAPGLEAWEEAGAGGVLPGDRLVLRRVDLKCS